MLLRNKSSINQLPVVFVKLNFSNCNWMFHMSQLIRARDFEMEMIARECENAASSSSKEGVADEEHLRRLNDRIRVSL